MNIGILALIIGLVCAVITMIAHRPDRETTTPDYTRIYEAVVPHEIPEKIS